MYLFCTDECVYACMYVMYPYVLTVCNLTVCVNVCVSLSMHISLCMFSFYLFVIMCVCYLCECVSVCVCERFCLHLLHVAVMES